MTSSPEAEKRAVRVRPGMASRRTPITSGSISTRSPTPTPCSPSEVARAVQRAFSSRGYPLIDDRKASPTEDIWFSLEARRTPSSSRGRVTAGLATPRAARIESALGSRLRVTAVGSSTDLFILGKPTIATVAICSDGDVELSNVQYSCRDTKVSNLGQLAPYFTGHAEATVARGVLVEIANSR
jgi:hypothetical protein